MRVLLTTPTFPPFNSGLGNAVHRHAVGLSKRGLDVVVATGGQQRATEIIDGIRVERFAVTGADYLRSPIRGDVEGYSKFLLGETYDVIVLEAWQTDPEFNTSRALVQVSTFLAAFSGLYLTVSTVTDDKYREQFFGSVEHELERAVGVRAVYLALRDR